MPILTCTECGHQVFLSMQSTLVSGASTRDVLRIVFVCQNNVDPLHVRDAICGAKTIFEIKGDSITFAPGKLLTADISPKLSPDVKGLFQDATLCFYGQSMKGVAGLCRSAVEQALDEKGAKGHDLPEKIATGKKLGVITDEEEGMAQAVRLIGRNALHRLSPVSQTQAHSLLNGTLDLLNAISGRTLKPASP